MNDLEGSWLGADKVAHFMFAPAITGWALVFAQPTSVFWAAVVWGIAVLVGALWEASNHWVVLRGTRGISARDLVAFIAGDLLALALLLVAVLR